ncbi:MAG: hypothetical protein JWO08_4177, partial [Verrucomicrobiaceae bacterium]|nr:hypothetical protein [Verrucomicrobiaceae bacterium]
MKTTMDELTFAPKAGLACLASIFVACSVFGEEAAVTLPPAPATATPAAVVRDPDLPQPFDATVLTPILTNSPFNRAVNLSDSLVLTGMATVDGKPMVTLMDKELKRTYVVTDEPNENGWKLAEVPHQVELKKALV